MSEIIDVNGNIVSRLDVVPETKGFTVAHLVEQECQDVIDRCTLARNADKLRGHRKPETYRCVAEIPLALVSLLKAQGIDIMQDPAAMRRLLNDPAFKAFRTTEGKV